jgi:hypothetical protein
MDEPKGDYDKQHLQDDCSPSPESAEKTAVTNGQNTEGGRTTTNPAHNPTAPSGFWKNPNHWIAIASVVMAVSTGLYTYFALQQWHTMQEEIRRAHRPWLGVVNPIEITEPLTFAGDSMDATISIRFGVKNAGNSPAVGTQNDLALLINPAPEAIARILHAPCDVVPSPTGAFILPGDTYITEIMLTANRPFTRADPSSAWLTMCLTYFDEFGKPHGTGLAWTYVTPDQKRRFAPSGVVRGTFRENGTNVSSY